MSCHEGIVQKYSKPFQTSWVIARHYKMEFMLGMEACELAIYWWHFPEEPFPFCFVYNTIQDKVLFIFNFIAYKTFSVGNRCFGAGMSTPFYFQ